MAFQARVDVDVSPMAAVAKEAQRRAIAKKSLRKGAAEVRTAVRRRAPRRKGGGGGTTAASIGVRIEAGTRGKTVAYAVIGARKGYSRQKVVPSWGKPGKKPVNVVPYFIVHLIELGTRAHALGKGAKLARRNKPGQQDVGQSKGVMHPGAKADPFIRDGYAASKDRAAAAVAAALLAETEKAIAKAAAKLKRAK